jgi:CheY-like chemotaxis protein
MPDEPAAAAGLLLSDDLLFTSRVTATARAHGLAIRVVRSGSALLETARQQRPRCVLLDLGQAGPVVAELVRGLRSGPGPTMLVVAYGSHVDTATLRAAREAGCDVVLPRSKFVDELPRALPDWLAGRPRPSDAAAQETGNE